MNLPLLYRIFSVLHIIMGLIMIFGGSTLSEMSGWEHSVGIATQAEHHGAALICISILFWMIPRWMSDDKLKEVTSTAIIIQIILAIMPIYHAWIGAIPVDGSLFVMMTILIVLIVLFYIASSKKTIETKEQ